jgi:transposase InsO family protein
VLWLTDITEHPTRDGKVYCCVVLDAYSRRVVGWAIDRRCETALVNDAVVRASESRVPRQPRASAYRHTGRLRGRGRGGRACARQALYPERLHSSLGSAPTWPRPSWWPPGTVGGQHPHGLDVAAALEVL